MAHRCPTPICLLCLRRVHSQYCSSRLLVWMLQLLAEFDKGPEEGNICCFSAGNSSLTDSRRPAAKCCVGLPSSSAARRFALTTGAEVGRSWLDFASERLRARQGTAAGCIGCPWIRFPGAGVTATCYAAVCFTTGAPPPSPKRCACLLDINQFHIEHQPSCIGMTGSRGVTQRRRADQRRPGP